MTVKTIDIHAGLEHHVYLRSKRSFLSVEIARGTESRRNFKIYSNVDRAMGAKFALGVPKVPTELFLTTQIKTIEGASSALSSPEAA